MDNEKTLMPDHAFEAETLAADLAQVHDIYSAFFSALTAADWKHPQPGANGEWNLREVVAHLGALTELGQESIEAALRGEAMAVPGLSNRFQFSAFNRQKINERLELAPEVLSSSFLDALSRSIDTAAAVSPRELDCTVSLPIYNQPVRVRELLGIQVMHPGITHAAQVAEPAGVAPLWKRLTVDGRRRTIGRVVRALSLLYRTDLGGDLQAAVVFKVGGEGGGTWHAIFTPQNARSGTGAVTNADLTLSFGDAVHFCQMFTKRLNLLRGMLSGSFRPRGNLRLFFRFRSLFSVDVTS